MALRRHVAEAVLELVRDESLAGQAMAVMHGQPRRLVPAAMGVR